MRAYLHGIWRCRYFWLNLVRIDLRARYHGSLLGLGWSLMQPVTMTVIFCVIVRPLLMPEQSLIHCVLFFLTGLVCWQFIVNVTIQGCQSLFRGEAYIRQYPAPLAIYPLRTVLGFAVNLLIVFFAVALLSCARHHGIPIALWTLLPSVILLLLLGWSLAVLAAFVNVYYRDMQHLCEVGFQILFYGTPILYTPELLRERNLDWILYWNPLVPLFHLVREPLLYARSPTSMMYLWGGLVVLVFFVTACAMLATQQRRIIYHI